MKAWFGQIFGTLESSFEVDEFIDAGDSVVAVFRQVARGRASGVELTNDFAFVYGFRSGKFIYMDGYRRASGRLLLSRKAEARGDPRLTCRVSSNAGVWAHLHGRVLPRESGGSGRV